MELLMLQFVPVAPCPVIKSLLLS